MVDAENIWLCCVHLSRDVATTSCHSEHRGASVRASPPQQSSTATVVLADISGRDFVGAEREQECHHLAEWQSFPTTE